MSYSSCEDPDACTCYKCVGPEYTYHNGMKILENNFMDHTFHESCDSCGRAKTEYRDLGTKGYYECWWCNKRAKSSHS